MSDDGRFLRTILDPSALSMHYLDVAKNRDVLLVARETATTALKAVEAATSANQALCEAAKMHKFEKDNCTRCGAHTSRFAVDGPSFHNGRGS